MFSFSIGFSQSYLGFSAGICNPIAHESLPRNDRFISIKNIENQSSFYSSIELKERRNKKFNFGFNLTLIHQVLRYDEKFVHHFSSLTKYDYNTYSLHNKIEFEIKLGNKPNFIAFGPDFEVVLYSYEKLERSSYYPNSTYYSEKKIATNYLNIRLFVALYKDFKLNENKILFIRSEASYPLGRTYSNIKTLDFQLGMGIRFFLPNLKLTLDNNETFKGKPYILN